MLLYRKGLAADIILSLNLVEDVTILFYIGDILRYPLKVSHRSNRNRLLFNLYSLLTQKCFAKALSRLQDGSNISFSLNQTDFESVQMCKGHTSQTVQLSELLHRCATVIRLTFDSEFNRRSYTSHTGAFTQNVLSVSDFTCNRRTCTHILYLCSIYHVSSTHLYSGTNNLL